MQCEGDGMRTRRNWTEGRGKIRARVMMNEGREWEIGEKMVVGREASCSPRVRGGGCTTLFEGRTVQ